MRLIVAACLVMCPTIASAQRDIVSSADSLAMYANSRSPMTDTLDAVTVAQSADSGDRRLRFSVGLICNDASTSGRMLSRSLLFVFNYDPDTLLRTVPGHYFAPDSIVLAMTAPARIADDTGYYNLRWRVLPAPTRVSPRWKGTFMREGGASMLVQDVRMVPELFGHILANVTTSSTLYVQSRVGTVPSALFANAQAIRSSARDYVARFTFDPEKKQMWRRALTECGVRWSARQR